MKHDFLKSTYIFDYVSYYKPSEQTTGWLQLPGTTPADTPTIKLKQVEEDDGARDEQGLSRLDAVDPCQDVDGVGAEHGQHAHVDVVQNTCRPEDGHTSRATVQCVMLCYSHCDIIITLLHYP